MFLTVTLVARITGRCCLLRRGGRGHNSLIKLMYTFTFISVKGNVEYNHQLINQSINQQSDTNMQPNTGV